MIPTDNERNRKIIPRWQTLAKSVNLGELGSAVAKPNHTYDPSAEFQLELCRKRLAWTSQQNLDAAEELVAASVLSGIIDRNTEAAARLLLQEGGPLPGTAQLARAVLGEKQQVAEPVLRHEAALRTEIAKRKFRAIATPKDSLLLAETALLYTVLGQPAPAKTLLRRALALAPANRYVVRSAIRFFLHNRDVDEAVSLARRIATTSSDPWLLSASMAAIDAAGERPQNFKKSVNLLGHNSFSDFDLSELASAIATTHFDAGEVKIARKRFRQSLAEPTENAVAQAEWAQSKDRSIDVPQHALDLPGAFEAQALNAFHLGQWAESQRASELWIHTEPFNPAPFIHASWLHTGIFDNPLEATKSAGLGLLSNPDDPGLLNNLAVAQAMIGYTEKAEMSLAKARRVAGDIELKLTIEATSGLIELRKGRIESGIAHYTNAIEFAHDRRWPNQVLRALCYFGKELSRHDHASAHLIADRVEEIRGEMHRRGRIVSPEIEHFVQQIRRQKEAPRKPLQFSAKWLDALAGSLLPN